MRKEIPSPDGTISKKQVSPIEDIVITHDIPPANDILKDWNGMNAKGVLTGEELILDYMLKKKSKPQEVIQEEEEIKIPKELYVSDEEHFQRVNDGYAKYRREYVPVQKPEKTRKGLIGFCIEVLVGAVLIVFGILTTKLTGELALFIYTLQIGTLMLVAGCIFIYDAIKRRKTT